MGVGRMGDGRGERVKRGEGACLTRHCRDPAGTHTLTGTHPAYAKSPHDLRRGGMRAAWLASCAREVGTRPAALALLSAHSPQQGTSMGHRRPLEELWGACRRRTLT